MPERPAPTISTSTWSDISLLWRGLASALVGRGYQHSVEWGQLLVGKFDTLYRERRHADFITRPRYGDARPPRFTRQRRRARARDPRHGRAPARGAPAGRDLGRGPGQGRRHLPPQLLLLLPLQGRGPADPRRPHGRGGGRQPRGGAGEAGRGTARGVAPGAAVLLRDLRLAPRRDPRRGRAARDQRRG